MILHKFYEKESATNKVTQYFFILFLMSHTIFAQWERFNNISFPNWATGYAIDAKENRIVFSVDHYIISSSDNGSNWNISDLDSLKITQRIFAIDVSLVNNKIWAGLGDGRIIFSSDFGKNWIVQFQGSNKTEFINYIEMFDDDNGIAYGDAIYPGESGIFLITTNGGNSWQIIENHSMVNSSDVWRRVDFLDINTGFVFQHNGEQGGGIYKTSDKGISWNRINCCESISTVVKFYNEDYGIAAGFNFDMNRTGIYKTTDGGHNWDFIVTEMDMVTDVEFFPNNPSKIWLCDLNDELLYSSDSGKTWTNEFTPAGYKSTRNWDVVMTENNVGWMISNNGNLHKFINSTTSVDLLSKEFEYYGLAQNYPNPFNPITKIKYSIPEQTYVEVKVYDMLGNEVTALVNSEKLPGTYEVEFNGREFVSGIYFYRLSTEAFTKTKKLVLLK